MIDYSYGDIEDNPFRSSLFESLEIQFPGQANKNTTFKDACINMANTVMKYYPDIDFALSGGIWSYISYLSFAEAGFKPPVKIIRLPHNINEHDVQAAEALANHVGSPIYFVDISLKDEVLDSYIHVAEKYQTYNFSDSIIARFAEHSGNNVFVCDPIVMKRNVEPGWRLILDEGSDFYWHRFNYANRHNIIRSFFTGSPDILYQFLKLPVVSDILEDRLKNKLSTDTSLRKIFEGAGWKIPERLFLRHTFTDSLPEFSKKMNAKIIQETGYKKRFITIPYNDLLQSVCGEGYQCKYI